MFAAMHWWRGSFWMMAPLMLIFAGVAYWKIPDRLSQEAERNRFAGVPFLRFGTLAAGVLCVAASGSVPGLVQQAALKCVRAIRFGPLRAAGCREVIK
jgi:hypothetical protein